MQNHLLTGPALLLSTTAWLLNCSWQSLAGLLVTLPFCLGQHNVGRKLWFLCLGHLQSGFDVCQQSGMASLPSVVGTTTVSSLRKKADELTGFCKGMFMMTFFHENALSWSTSYILFDE